MSRQQAPGCIGISDDVAVSGRTEEEHDHNLLNLMEVAQRESLVFNSSKCIIKADRINFFGSIDSKYGTSPDPEKIRDIENMPSPQDKDNLRRFIGLMNCHHTLHTLQIRWHPSESY